MQKKKILTEQSIITGFIPKILKFNKEAIKLNLLKNYSNNNYKSFDDFNYHRDYLNIDFQQHLTWIHDFIKDDYNLNYSSCLVQNSLSGIVLFPGQSIDFHHHIDDYDIHNSNDFTCIYTLEAFENSSHIMFEYEQGRKRHARWKETLETNKYVLFNSELKHSYTINKSDKPLFAVCWTFQII